MNTLVEATLAAKARDPNIGMRVNAGQFIIVRAVPRRGRAYDVVDLAGPMPGWLAIQCLTRFAAGGELVDEAGGEA